MAVAVALGELMLFSDQESFGLSLALVGIFLDSNSKGVPLGFWKVHVVSPEFSDYSLSS
jgi:hypothetical protein